MSLLISLPLYCQSELKWTCSVLFGEIIGVSYRVEVKNIDGVEIILPNGSTIKFEDHFFSKLGSVGGIAEINTPTVAELAINEFIPEVNLPVIYGSNKLVIESNLISCSIDIFSSCFFMLSRWEEIVSNDRDQHDRFPATSSLAFKAGFLYRPIVDEYAEMLWSMLKHLCPVLERKGRQGQVVVSCDVDNPFDCSVSTFKKMVRTASADLAKRKSIGLAAHRARRYLYNRLGNYRFDPYYTFDWYMGVCAEHGRNATFFFIPDHTAGAIDGCYDLHEPRILSLIKTIVDRGHDVGVHGSYNTYQDAAQVKRERQRMIAACNQAGVAVKVQGNRQHYLRWDAAQTQDHLEAAGFEYDTSGSYADMPGFRYGTSHEFSMWSWKKKAPLKIKQRPLVVMECSVVDTPYLGLGYSEEAMDLMLMLKSRAMKYSGDFRLLWHNSHFMNKEDKQFFVELLQ